MRQNFHRREGCMSFRRSLGSMIALAVSVMFVLIGNNGEINPGMVNVGNCIAYDRYSIVLMQVPMGYSFVFLYIDIGVSVIARDNSRPHVWAGIHKVYYGDFVEYSELFMEEKLVVRAKSLTIGVWVRISYFSLVMEVSECRRSPSQILTYGRMMTVEASLLGVFFRD